MKSLKIPVLLTCPAGAVECLAKLRAVLDPIERVTSEWPSLERWERELPTWFVSACASPMSNDEAQVWLEHWRTMSKEDQLKASEEQRWSLPDWLYWMEPSQAAWRWAGATVRTQSELEVTLAVEGWPVALGAFEWLARTAGAEAVSVVPLSG